MQLTEGNVIDQRYLLHELLGEGGMGCVFRAKDLELERVVAVKFMSAELLVDIEPRLRFEREAKILSGLVHPNIVQLFRYGILPNHMPFMVMEYIQGCSLRKLINDDKLSIADCINVAVQVCEGMNAAHNQGVLHRDLKPENILMPEADTADSRPFTVKLIDFGLAKAEGILHQRLTQTGLVLGSLCYMSPEQSTGQKANKAADIYSLGCILYEMLAGVPPFMSESPTGFLYKHANEQVPPLPQNHGQEQIPEKMYDIICKAMHKQPEQRYESMNALKLDLELLVRGELDSIVATTTVSSQPKTNSAHARQRVKALCLGALAITIAVATSIIWRSGWKSEEAADANSVLSGTSGASFEANLRHIWRKRIDSPQTLLELDQELEKLIIKQTSAVRPPDGSVFQAYLMRAGLTEAYCNAADDHKRASKCREFNEAALQYATVSKNEYAPQAAIPLCFLAEELQDKDQDKAEQYYRLSDKLFSSKKLGIGHFRVQPELPGADYGILPQRAAFMVAYYDLIRVNNQQAADKLHSMMNAQVKSEGRLARSLMGAAIRLRAWYLERGLKAKALQVNSKIEGSWQQCARDQRPEQTQFLLDAGCAYAHAEEWELAQRVFVKAIEADYNGNSSPATDVAVTLIRVFRLIPPSRQNAKFLQAFQSLSQKVIEDSRYGAVKKIIKLSSQAVFQESPVVDKFISSVASGLDLKQFSDKDAKAIEREFALRNQLQKLRSKHNATWAHCASELFEQFLTQDPDIALGFAVYFQKECIDSRVPELASEIASNVVRSTNRFPASEFVFFKLLMLGQGLSGANSELSDELFLRACAALSKCPENISFEATGSFQDEALQRSFRVAQSGRYGKAAEILRSAADAQAHMRGPNLAPKKCLILLKWMVLSELSGDVKQAATAVANLNTFLESISPSEKLDMFPYLWLWNEAIHPQKRERLWQELVKNHALIKAPSLPVAQLLIEFELISFYLATGPQNILEERMRNAIKLREQIQSAQLTPTTLQLRLCLGRILLTTHGEVEANQIFQEYIDAIHNKTIPPDPNSYIYCLEQKAHHCFRLENFALCLKTCEELEKTDNPYFKMKSHYLKAMCHWRKNNISSSSEEFKKAFQWRAKTAPLFASWLPDLPLQYEIFKKTFEQSAK